MLWTILGLSSMFFLIGMTTKYADPESPSSTQAGGNKKNKTSNKSKTRRKRVRKNKSYKK